MGAIAFLVLDQIEQREFVEIVAEAEATVPNLKHPSTEEALTIMSNVNGRLKGIRIEAKPPSPEDNKLKFTSSHENLHNPVGACASYTQVLAKSLMTAGYQVRKVGLAQGDKRAIHHVLEVREGQSWVLMDAFYNLAFRARDGHLASAEEVSQDWLWFQKQVPADYDPSFNYKQFYYTNWDRIPILGWIIRSSPALSQYLYQRGISLRYLFFNTYKWAASGCAILAIGCWFARRRLLAVGAIARERQKNPLSAGQG